MSEEMGMIAAIAGMSLLGRRRSSEPKALEVIVAEERARLEREAEARRIEEKRQREETERAPRAYRRRLLKEQTKVKKVRR